MKGGASFYSVGQDLFSLVAGGVLKGDTTTAGG